MSISASAISMAVAKRSSGSFAIARCASESSSSGTWGAPSRADGTGALRWAYIFATSLSRSNGSVPVSASNSTQPSA